MPRSCFFLALANLLLLTANGIFLGGGWALAERMAGARLERALGRARNCRVHFWETSGFELLGGQARVVRIDERGLRLRNGLRITALHLVMKGIEGGGGSLRRLDSARFYVRVRETDLNRFLRLKSKGLIKPVPVARIRAGEMEVTGTKMGFSLPLRVRGGLEVDDGTRIKFVLHGQGHMKDLLMSGLLWALNPIVDLRDADFGRYGVTVERLQLSEGVLEVEGTASPPMPFVFPRQREPEPPEEPDTDDEDAQDLHTHEVGPVKEFATVR